MPAANDFHPAMAMLVAEHRLILRVIAYLCGIGESLNDGGTADTAVLRDAVAFLRQYADARHHGKEEDILFAALAAADSVKQQDCQFDSLIGSHCYAFYAR